MAIVYKIFSIPAELSSFLFIKEGEEITVNYVAFVQQSGNLFTTLIAQFDCSQVLIIIIWANTVSSGDSNSTATVAEVVS